MYLSSIKCLIKKTILKIISIFPINNIIMFESIPNLSDNTMEVFLEMIRKGINEKYRIVWWLFTEEKKASLPKYKNVEYLFIRNRIDKLRFYYFNSVAIGLICENRFFEKVKKEQISFYIGHGTPIKQCRNRYNVPESIDYVITPGYGVNDIHIKEYKIDSAKIRTLGYPRNDALYERSKNDIFHKEFDKVIVWYPTFRQSKFEDKHYKGNNLPILSDIESAKVINAVAKEKNVVIVVKLHFAQDCSLLRNSNLTNIVFVDDDFYVRNHVKAYEFLSTSDALLTDYSSVYFDYLILDRPIGLVWCDMEEYRDNIGLIDNLESYISAGDLLYDASDICKFIEAVSEGNDNKLGKRSNINKLANLKGKSTERVTSFILGKINDNG